MKFTFIKAKQALGSVVYYKKETIVENKGGQAGSLARTVEETLRPSTSCVNIGS